MAKAKGSEQMNWHDRLIGLGLLRSVSAGVQLDVTAVVRRTRDGNLEHATLCDHNCLAEDGHYSCPAAFSINPGVDIGSLAPAAVLLDGITVAVDAVKKAKRTFLAGPFRQYCIDFKIPDGVASALAESISARPVEVNVTGGNPEVHPELCTILTGLGAREDIVSNLTTTGRRFLTDPDFFEQFMLAPPDSLSLSADDFYSADQVRVLASKSAAELRDIWQGVSPAHGQRQKSVEAIFVAQRMKDADKPHTGFNLVVHPGNIEQAEELITALEDCFPGSHIFPYPVQTGYRAAPGVWGDTVPLEVFVDRMVAAHFDQPLPVTKRLHYWLMLKAVCLVYRGEPKILRDMACGAGFWRCYRQPGTIRYLQIGKGAALASPGYGGGFPGCFWNTGTVSLEKRQIWDMDMPEVAAYLFRGAWTLASGKSKACLGCGFPRLLFDVVSSEMGMNPDLVDTYLQLRRSYAGY